MATRMRKAESGEAVLLRAGAPAKGEFRCAGCGYGAAVHTVLPECPMCHGSMWAFAEWHPFTRLSPAGDPAEREPDAHLLL